jgi:hypothetical protein
MHSVAVTTSSTMQDFLSQLPAPLPLHILLELPDLKALYAAILSSPCLYAVFCQNAHTVFARIAERSSTLELVRPIMIYMHLLNILYHAGRGEVSSAIQWAELEKTVTSMNFEDFTCKNVPTPVIFHTAAQAVRIHDVAYFIIRSKLDYLTTLTFQKLADPQDQYGRPFRKSVYDFSGVPLRIPSHLRDPSWVEENRVIRILWALCAGWRMYRAKGISTPGLTQIRERLLNLLGLNSEFTRHLPDEIVECLLRGPTLRSPEDVQTAPASEVSPKGFSILQTYHIQHPVHACQNFEPHLQSTSPHFRYSPAVCPDSPIGIYDWGLGRRRLSECDNENRWLRVAMLRTHSPLQECSRRIFECLGFSIWDNLRFMTELRLKSIPHFCHPPFPQDPEDPNDPLGQIKHSDELFRLLKVYEHQSQREREGWRR